MNNAFKPLVLMGIFTVILTQANVVNSAAVAPLSQKFEPPTNSLSLENMSIESLRYSTGLFYSDGTARQVVVAGTTRQRALEALSKKPDRPEQTGLSQYREELGPTPLQLQQQNKERSIRRLEEQEKLQVERDLRDALR